MRVITYRTSDNPNKVFKTLEEVQSFDCRALQPVDYLAPVLRFTKSDFAMDTNYCYIEPYNTFYFINDRILEDGGIIHLACSIDVLYTYREQLLECSATVIRNGDIGTNIMTDNKLPINPNKVFLEGIDLGNYRNPESGYVIGVV